MTDVNEPLPEWKHNILSKKFKDWDALRTALKEIYGGRSPKSVWKEEPKNLLEEVQKKDIMEKS
ncbi:uncharacterized protein FFB20_00795 [Fusarium fujikuroi]|uniref:Uncharacterized protein n=1 Tax=Gibberella fujikuroi (strain CBS 195.34 / IMI 58289 / NRRL A-6831) TaxID=1279085 RepID=S0EMM1_GIBF5|nr:uncharacterized protein FFUJ_11922 [Fusarium fujikuroi IMI 58289]KLP04157.1 uncharacterized protein Y057_2100 [Fusarium fujikuroi]CCT75877.1 uncharacterized protein FFUJ_11922 [Fusarium fujikuroi IMI 58289]SCN64578.1 uncharacterized protein FFB20_00795 [Fusarium fujikuroi]SCN70766.1 uncharacterized protein FFE2_02100 [Fusarium fujikuroi]SCO14681.1 uncharacterized protein FFC1_12234 [Fusarium fujikuroi]